MGMPTPKRRHGKGPTQRGGLPGFPRYPLLPFLAGFLAFSHLWTWAFWALAAALSEETIWDGRGTVFFYIGGAGVPLGALVMVSAGGGKDALKELGRRLADPRRISWRWWALILTLFPLLNLLAAVLATVIWPHAGPALKLDEVRALAGQPGALLRWAAFILLMGPCPEEIGWRGFLLDHLEGHWKAWTSTLMVGLCWWSWHLPLFVLPGYFDPFGGAPMGAAGYFWDIMVGAVLYTWIYNNTRRSVLAVILFHFMGNLSGELMDPSPEARFLQAILQSVLAVAVLMKWGPGSLTRRGRNLGASHREAEAGTG